MFFRALIVAVISAGFLVACGGPPTKPLTEEQICGPGGCDSCVGFTCGSNPDGGVP